MRTYSLTPFYRKKNGGYIHSLPHNRLMLYKKQLDHSVLDSCMPSWLRLCSWWGIQAACEEIYRGGVWLPTYFGSRKYCIRPQNLEVANQQFDVSVLRFCISDVVNKHNNCGMRLRLLFSLWLSIISLFADRINKLSNTINKMSHFNTHAKENITLFDFCTEAIYDIYDTSYNTADN